MFSGHLLGLDSFEPAPKITNEFMQKRAIIHGHVFNFDSIEPALKIIKYNFT